MKKLLQGIELKEGWQTRALFAVTGFILLIIAYLNFQDFKGLFVPLMILSGIVFIGVYFFLYSKNEETQSNIYEFNETRFWRTSIKVLIAFILAAAGLYLDVKKVPLIPYLLFFFSVIQVMLAASMKGMTIVTYTSELNTVKTDINTIKKMVLNMLLSFVVLILISKGMVFFSFIILFIMAVIMGDFFNANEFAEKDSDKSADYVLVGITFIAALFFAFYRLEQVPPGYTYDARRGFDILLAIKRGEHFGIFLPQGDVNAASLNIYLLYYFCKVFGFEISNMRILSVISFVVSMPFFYLLIKEMYNRKMAVFALVFYVMMFNIILISRIDTLLFFPVLILIIGLYFLLSGIRKGNIFLLALAGIMAGLNMYTYHSGKIHIIILFITFFIYAVDFKRIKESWKNTANLFVILFAALIVFLPLLYFIVTQYNVFMARASGFAPKMDFSVIKFFMGNILEIINALTVKGSNYEYVNLPFRPVFTGIQQFLFVLGSAYLLYGIKRKSNLLLLSWLFVSVLPEVFFIHHASPYYFRMMLAFPAFAITAALGCNVIYRYASKMVRADKKVIYITVFSIIFIYSALSSFNDYFNKYAKNPKVMDQFDYVASGIEKEIIENKDNIVYYSGYISHIRSLFCVYCGNLNHVIKKDVSSLALSDFYTADNRDVVIIAENIYAYYFDHLKEYFPNIIIQKVENKEGLKLWVDPIRPEFKYIVVKIPNSDIKETFGLKAELYSKGKLISEENFQASLELPAGTDRVILKGLFDMPEYAGLKLNFGGAIARLVSIDNTAYDGRKIYKGLHYFKADIDTAADKQIKVYWDIKGNKELIPVKHFVKNGRIFGLKASYTFNYLDKKLQVLEPIVENRYLAYMPKFETGGDSFFNARWDGYFYASADGLYAFSIYTPAGYCNSIEVNGKEVFSFFDEKRSTSVMLKKGWHKLNVISYSQVIAFMNMVYRLQVKGPGDFAERTVYYNELSPFYH